MIAVCNASPLIVLAKAGMIDFLPQQFSKVLVPTAVWDEILSGSNDDPMRNLLGKYAWMKQVRLEPPLSPLACWNLGRGESEVIEYARRHPESIALLDDRLARRAAEVMKIKVFGTLGIIARQAKSDPAISFDDSIEHLKNAGLYLDEKLINSVRTKIKIF